MVLFFPSQQTLDCVSDSGHVLGKIQFDGAKDEYVFVVSEASITLKDAEKACIAQRLASLSSGQSSIPMQDDD